MTTRRALLAGIVAALLLIGCGRSGDGATPSAAQPSTPTGTITVFAAASLTGTFTELGRQFEQQHPGTKVAFSFGPSSGLATQIQNGAPADLFAAASPATMQQAVTAKAVGEPVVFARNALRIAVPPANPGGVRRLADLARPRLKVALCQEKVPCGKVAATVLHGAGVQVTPVTREVDVKAVLSKVSLGEVDAGLVYVTDVLAAGGKVRGIEIPAAENATTDYLVAAVSASRNGVTAQAFARFVTSPEAARVLTAAGFSRP
jgi:molybdate transport system substrate-binding protein